MSSEKYSEFNLDFWLKNNMPLESLYPKPMGNYCGADYAQGYVLDAQGNIYKCWSDVGVMEQRIGTAHDWNETNKNQQLVTYSHKACLKNICCMIPQKIQYVVNVNLCQYVLGDVLIVE